MSPNWRPAVPLSILARWKIENESFNTLKTKGYHLEHNFGHGDANLAARLWAGVAAARDPGGVKTLLEIFKPAKIGRRPAQPPFFEWIFALPALKSTQGPR